MKRIARLFCEYRPLRLLTKDKDTIIFQRKLRTIPFATWYVPGFAMLLNNILTGFTHQNSIVLGVLAAAGYALHQRYRLKLSSQILLITTNHHANRFDLALSDYKKHIHYGYFKDSGLFTIGIHQSHILECIDQATKKPIKTVEELKDVKWATLRIKNIYTNQPIDFHLELANNHQQKYRDYLYAMLCKQQIKLQ